MNDKFNPVQTTPFSIAYKIKSRVWGIVNVTFFRWNFFFMRKYRVAILKLFNARVDWSCSIDRTATIIAPWNLTMGEKSSIGEYSLVMCHNNVRIGSKSCIGRDVYILTGSHNVFSYNFELTTSPIIIGDNVWIATRSTIGKGVTIGSGAVVAAESNVIKDVEPWMVVGGNPAKPIKKRIIKE